MVNMTFIRQRYQSAALTFGQAWGINPSQLAGISLKVPIAHETRKLKQVTIFLKTEQGNQRER